MTANDRAKIQVTGLAKTFHWKDKKSWQQVTALSGADLTVNAGEFLSVIGPSGCGKTTLLRILASLERADTGKVLIDGQEIEGPGPDRAMVFQSFGLLPWKTVLENVRFPLEANGVPRVDATVRANAQIRRVGLEGFESSHPHRLSGGMQQRVGIARALALDADILLMDEPFGAIDAQTREYMQEELMRLWTGSGKTVVLVTHDLDEAVLLADRVAVMSRRPGQVQEILDIDLPRPRWEYDARAHEGFTSVRRRIWELLREDAAEDLREGTA